MDNQQTPTKTCTRCGETFPATSEYFYQGEYGLHAWCSPCYSDYDRQYAEHMREKARNRRARLLSVPGTHTAADIRAQIKAQTNKRGQLICWWCDKPIKGKYHVDHRIPLTKGGSNDARNICITHERCNESKGAKLPHEFNGRLL